MSRVVAVGKQDFSSLIDRNNFYIDKTHFIKEWWESDDPVTLTTRPRRFGKTLLMSMVEQFFSTEYKAKGYLFEGLRIFKEKKYRELQGTYPVIFLSFANVKGNTLEKFYKKIQSCFAELFGKKEYLLESDLLRKAEKKKFESDYYNNREI